ncbi:hypothetical protein AGR1C_Lc120013 [Agrobacterium fabacearum TT111]|nr:hypothetical protein AGR1C_Lc120013 [Agrobacterium fabacearum TT111]
MAFKTDIAARDGDSGWLETHETTCHHGFSRTAFADNTDDFTRTNAERNIAYDTVVINTVYGKAKIFDLNKRLFHCLQSSHAGVETIADRISEQIYAK